MKKLMNRAFALLAAALLSGPAFADIDYSEDFEGLNAAAGDALSNAGWIVFGNVFGAYPGCPDYWYGYGTFPAPNGGPGFSSVVTGTSSGQAINVYSDYANANHVDGCIEANVFQQVNILPADADIYEFSFDTQVPAPPDDVLGPSVSTYGFVKVLHKDTFALELFLQVDTATPGPKSIIADLSGLAEEKLLQWGFASYASQYDTTGRWYDNVEFTTYVEPPPPQILYEGVPTMGTLGLLLLLTLFGGLGAAALARRP